MSRIPYTFWKKFAFPLLITSIVLLILVFIPGIRADFGTARSWIIVGGFSLQPSEIVKLTFLLYLATWFDRQDHKTIKDFSYGFLPFLFLLAVIVLLMVLQPDVGTMTIIVLEILIVYFIAGGAWAHLALLGGGGLSLIYLLIKIAPYRAARLTIFLHPELDPQGIGYHINQAFLAIGSGGLLGRGYGNSRQKFQYLPEVIGDSIFAVFAEEGGFIIASLFIALLVYFFIRGISIAHKIPDQYGKYIVYGVMGWIIVQSFVNIGAMVGVMPLTGVPLPFISSGGTSMVVTLAAIGLVINVSKYTKE
jgi:cell division protein FtsW